MSAATPERTEGQYHAPCAKCGRRDRSHTTFRKRPICADCFLEHVRTHPNKSVCPKTCRECAGYEKRSYH